VSYGEHLIEHIRAVAEPLIRELRDRPDIGRELMALVASAVLMAGLSNNNGEEQE
jgi:hypothetical protein